MNDLSKIAIAIQNLESINSNVDDVKATIETALDCLTYAKNTIGKSQPKAKPMATRVKRRKITPKSLFD